MLKTLTNNYRFFLLLAATPLCVYAFVSKLHPPIGGSEPGRTELEISLILLLALQNVLFGLFLFIAHKFWQEPSLSSFFQKYKWLFAAFWLIPSTYLGLVLFGLLQTTVSIDKGTDIILQQIPFWQQAITFLSWTLPAGCAGFIAASIIGWAIEIWRNRAAKTHTT
ncbi:MAG: hypothetical protein K2W82_11905 [Candidatus Obscuribacterales bacterium]|jgi:hypothetical protein|nr:hypothetical protein [Candidatus Obscuribacterales bacterium]